MCLKKGKSGKNMLNIFGEFIESNKIRLWAVLDAEI